MSKRKSTEGLPHAPAAKRPMVDKGSASTKAGQTLVKSSQILLGHSHCFKCEQSKPISCFSKNSRRASGISARCKNCISVQRKIFVAKKEAQRILLVGRTRVCTGCTEDLPLDQYYKDDSRDGYRRRCKTCHNAMTESFRIKRVAQDKPQIASKKCRKCEKVQPVSCFIRKKDHTDGLESCCAKCQDECRQAQPHFTSRNRFCRRVVTSMWHNSLQRRAKGHIFENAFSYDRETLDNRLTLQGDACAISGLPLSFLSLTDWMMSPDRIDNDDDYTDSNVSIVAAEFNTRYSWSHKSLLGFYDMSKSHRPSQWPYTHLTYQDVWLPTFSDYATSTCHIGQHMLRPHERRSPIRHSCFSCGSFWGNITAKLTKDFSNTKNHVAQVNAKGPTTRLMHSITKEYLFRLYVYQRGTCYYSGVPFHHGACETQLDKLRQMSIERLDSCKGYVPGNVALICLGFQGSDKSRLAKYSHGGHSGWSKLKVAYLWNWLEESEYGAQAPSISWEEFKAKNSARYPLALRLGPAVVEVPCEQLWIKCC